MRTAPPLSLLILTFSLGCGTTEPAPVAAPAPAKGPPPVRVQPSTDRAIDAVLAPAVQASGATLPADPACGGSFLVALDGQRAAIAVAGVPGGYRLVGATEGPNPRALDAIFERFHATPLRCPNVEVFVGDGDQDGKDEVVVALSDDRAPDPPFFAVQAFRFNGEMPAEAPEARACLSGVSDLPGVHKALGVANPGVSSSNKAD